VIEVGPAWVRSANAGRYALTDAVASGLAMFDTARLDRAGESDISHRDERRQPMIDEALLDILVCPADRGPLLLIDDEVLYNPRLRRAYRIEDGIPVLLIDEARAVDDDEHARLMTRVRSADPQ
jgi:uncharacterized protein YbaR (Trm112 family)